MEDTLVSIIIPVYNCEDYVADTINCALNQTWKNIEIIVIDDGSTDNSLVVAKQFVSEKVKVFTQANKGASAARNHGLRKAKGDYIQFLDADDLLSSDKIKKQLKELKLNPNSVAICSSVHFFSEDGNNKHIKKINYFKKENEPTEFLKILFGYSKRYPGTMVEIHCWLVPIAVIKNAGEWDETLTVDDDGEYFNRVILNVEKIIYIDDATACYRKYSNGVSLSNSAKTGSGLKSSVLALTLKQQHLDAFDNGKILSHLLARHYWELAVKAYPKYLAIYKFCSEKSKELKYSRPKFQGGKLGFVLTQVFGWKSVRILQTLKHKNGY